MRAIGGAILWLASVSAADPPPDPSDRSRVASIEIGGCRTSLELEEDETWLDYDNGCPQSIEEKAAVLDTLLAQLFGDACVPGNVGSIRTGWSKRLSEERARSLALRAHESAEWKLLLGKRRELGAGDHGMAAPFIARLIDERGLYREIKRALQRHGAVVASARVEKPVVGLPSMTRSEDWLLEHGVAKDELLPLDAVVWLLLDRSSAATSSGATRRP